MHNIEHYSYLLTTSKEDILAELNEHVKHETYHEGGSGIGSIRWYNDVCSSFNDAIKFLERYDKGWYDQLAVKYKSLPNGVSNRKLDTLRDRLKVLNVKYREINSNLEFKSFKASLISCKNCNSKLNKDYLNNNYCPLCRNDLRSDTIKQKINDLKNRIDALNKDIQVEEDLLTDKKGVVKWLVKIEYHT